MVDIVVGLDHAFEDASSNGIRMEILHDMDAAVCNGAQVAHDSMAIAQATASLLAAVASHGGQALTEPQRIAWLKAWRHRIGTHNTQQVLQCEEEPDDDFRCDRAAALEAYLRRFSRTNGLGIVLVGVWPFRRSAIECDTVEKIVDIVEPLLRLTQDLVVDVDEARNAGLFVYCAEWGVSIAEAKTTMRDRTARSELETWLAQQWRARMRSTVLQLVTLTRRHRRCEKLAIVRLAMTVLLIASMLSPVQYARRNSRTIG